MAATRLSAERCKAYSIELIKRAMKPHANKKNPASKGAYDSLDALLDEVKKIRIFKTSTGASVAAEVHSELAGIWFYDQRKFQEEKRGKEITYLYQYHKGAMEALDKIGNKLPVYE